MRTKGKRILSGIAGILVIVAFTVWILYSQTTSPVETPIEFNVKPVPKNAPTLNDTDIEKLLGLEQFRVVRRVGQVPTAIKESFANFVGIPFDLANPGELIDSDVDVPGAKSSRRLEFALLSEDSAVIVYEQGGFASAYNMVAFWFEEGGRSWGATLDSNPSDAASLRPLIQNGRFNSWERQKQLQAKLDNHDACVTDELKGLGCAHGTVLEDNGAAVKGIQVELVPTFKTGDAQWYATLRVFTDGTGRYNFNLLEAGDYLLAIHREDGPDARFPFATSYYPGVKDESDAGHVVIAPSSPSVLIPLRLKRVDVATIDVNVVWPDGTRPKSSNLLFHNLSYPHQGVIGDESPELIDGRGQFTLPKGFDYYARAVVHCDAGKVIESRESRPIQQIKVADGFTPTELTFIIPGPPCKLWSP